MKYLVDLMCDLFLIAGATIRARIWDFLLLILVLLIALAAYWAFLFLRAPIPPAPEPAPHPAEQTVPEGMWIIDTTSDTLIGLPDHSGHVQALDPPVLITEERR